METRDKHVFHNGTSQNTNSRGAHPKLDQLDAEPKKSNQIKKRESSHITAIQVMERGPQQGTGPFTHTDGSNVLELESIEC